MILLGYFVRVGSFGIIRVGSFGIIRFVLVRSLNLASLDLMVQVGSFGIVESSWFVRVGSTT